MFILRNLDFDIIGYFSETTSEASDWLSFFIISMMRNEKIPRTLDRSLVLTFPE